MSGLDQKKLIRNIIAVVGGMLVAAIVAATVERLGHSIWPPPTVPEGSTPEMATAAAVAYLKIAPIGAMLMIALAHCLGVAAGVAFAWKIQRDFKLAGIIVGIIFLLMGIMMFMWIKHPFWFVVVDMLAILIGIIIPWKMLKA